MSIKRPMDTPKTILAAAISMSLLGGGAFLAGAVLPASAYASPAQNDVVEIAITSGSLAKALNDLAAQTGLFVTGSADLTDGQSVSRLQGRYSVIEALNILLDGTGLTYSINNKTIVLSRSNARAEVKAKEPKALQQVDFKAITITGENIERDILATNTSVNLQTSREIERSIDLNIQDVFKRTANVVSTGVGVQSFDFSIRGISTDGVGGAGQEGLASIVIDGAPVTRLQTARGITSLFDVERIEVLRGPQSTNQGKNSLAGAIIVKTKDPEFEQDTQAKVSYASHNTYQAAVVNTGPINEELAYRVAFNRQHTDGFIDNTVRGEDDYAFNTSDTLRTKLLYVPEGLPLEVLLSHTLLRAEANNDIETYDPLNKRFVSLNPYDSQMETDQDLTSLNISYTLSDNWSINAISTYNQSESVDRNNAFALTAPTPDQVWRATGEQEEFTQELKLNYDTDALKGVVGLYYSDYEELALRDGIGIVGFSTPFGEQNIHVVFNNPTVVETKALFTEFDYHATPNLTLTAGFRYETIDYDLNSEGVITVQPIGFPLADLNLGGTQDQNVFLPKLAANYALTEGQHIGFTYSEGYRPGGVDLDVFTSTVTKYDSEHTKNYEFSYKGRFNDDLKVNSNLFFIDWEDMQTPGSADIRSGTYNAGKAEVYGAELEFGWKPVESLDTYLNLGYAKTKFDEFVINGGTDYSGNEFANAPRLTAALGSYLTQGDWVYGVEASYRDSYYDSIQNNFEVKSLTTVNLSATYTYQDFKVRAFANNVFDRVVLNRSTTEVEGETLGMLTDPRVVGVQLHYNF